MDACAMIKNRKFCPKERKAILATVDSTDRCNTGLSERCRTGVA